MLQWSSFTDSSMGNNDGTKTKDTATMTKEVEFKAATAKMELKNVKE